MKLIFLRHGQAQHNLPGWRGDTAPAELTPAGRQAVTRAAQELAQLQFAAIYTSPFKRTRETAGIVAQSQTSAIKVQTDARLSDVEVGHHLSRHWHRWQRLWLLRLKLMPRHERQQFVEQKLPGGHHLNKTTQPAGEFIAMLRQQQQSPILVVGHLHTFWMLSHHLRAEPLTAVLQDNHFISPASWVELGL